MSVPGSRAKRRVFERDGNRCRYCGLTVDRELPPEHPRRATVDHVIARSRGGRDSDDNYVTSCRRCNMEKGTMCPDTYRWYRHMLQRGYHHEELMEAIMMVEAAQGWLDPRARSLSDVNEGAIP